MTTRSDRKKGYIISSAASSALYLSVPVSFRRNSTDPHSPAPSTSPPILRRRHRTKGHTDADLYISDTPHFRASGASSSLLEYQDSYDAWRMLLATLATLAITACSVLGAVSKFPYVWPPSLTYTVQQPLSESNDLISRAFAAKAGDAPYSLSREEYNSRIVCPNGIKGAAGGIVFLVHGTALTGQETWGTGPFVTILPNKG
jgi:hypothetical protein